jgi:hypothetical protein
LYIGDLKDGLEPITKTIDAVIAEFANSYTDRYIQITTEAIEKRKDI